VTERSLEEPVPDSVEQDQDLIPDTAEPADSLPAELPFEADEADVAEQARELDPGEDDYR
jgi:hypothetical protein